MNVEELALRYAEAGRKVLPLHSIAKGRCSCGKKDCASPGKHPRTEHGAKDASSDVGIIHGWFEKWPDANLGMTLEGLVVVDVDPRNDGEATFDDLVAKHGALPYSWMQLTGGGGHHYAFKANGAAYGGSLGPGVDLKHGAGSFIVVEPSMHTSGRRYCWLDENGPFEGGVLADAPAWLGQNPGAKKTAPPGEKIGEGGRNAALSKVAYKLRKSGLTIEACTAALLAENAAKCDPPLSQEEVCKIARGKAAIEEETAAGFGDKTAQDIMGTAAQPPSYCVSERVPTGIVIIGARPKAKKSWWALQLALAKARGRLFMGKLATPGRVLGLFMEDNDRRMRRRLEFFGITSANAPANLHIVYDWAKGIEGVEALDRWMMQHPDTALINIDVLQRFRGPKDPKVNAYEADYDILSRLHGLTTKYPGLTIVIIHHVRKGAVDDPAEALNGSFAIAGAADAYIILRRHDQDRWIAHVDGRDWESWDHEFLWEFRQGEGWVQLGAFDGDADMTDRQAEIIAMANQAGCVTPTTVADKYGITKQAAHEALKALLAKDELYCKSGKYYPTKQGVFPVATYPGDGKQSPT